MASMRMRLRFTLALCCLPWLYPTGDTFARDLTFEDRVKAQEAIERVYYSRQIGVTEPFEEAVPRTILVRKVRNYLKESAALENLWHTQVTAETLRAELARMASQTQMPDRLRELYAALGEDPLLIQECLARPILVDRLMRNFYAYDAKIHAATRDEAEALHGKLVSGGIDPLAAHPRRMVTEVVRIQTVESAKSGGSTEAALDGAWNPSRLALEPDEFGRFRVSLPRRVGEIGPLVEERESFVARMVAQESEDHLRVVSFVLPKRPWDAWWSSVGRHFDETSVGVASPSIDRPKIPQAGPSETAPLSACLADDTWEGPPRLKAPDGRVGHSAVWTGSLMIVWGGEASTYLNSGGRYDPATDTWSPISSSNIPLGRIGHAAVWTGSQMIVWGGYDGVSYVNSGRRYDPVSDTWTTVTTTGAPSPRSTTAVWTGSEMIVWGGTNDTSYFATGGRYDPASDTWTPTSLINSPAGRAGHTAVWVKDRMVVWGGQGPSPFTSGGRYDPVADSWSSTSMIGAPSPRQLHTVVSTGNLMIVWGGQDVTTGAATNAGGRYDPTSDTWTPTSTIGVPARVGHTGVWTGSLMVVWGGYNSSFVHQGSRYDPATDTWTDASSDNSPAPRNGHSAVWTGSLMVVWGGKDTGSYLNTGGRYDPADDAWTPICPVMGPSSRRLQTAVWTGSLMIVWGGYDGSNLNTGGRYDPATATWTATSTTHAPTPRRSHTAVWTGNRMVVWGGEDDSYLDTGGRYDPTTDTWTSTGLSGAPSPRTDHTAVWTGSRMIVWGGFDGSYLNTGGQYDPATDSWTPTAMSDAPAPRDFHTGAWTGTLMVIWGGYGGSYLDTGGRYDPSTDAWTATSTVNAPSPRAYHSATWTGNLMVVWGGFGGAYLRTGGRYDPTTDTWTPTSTGNAPSARESHTAVWTGNLMIIWGGYGGSYLNTGDRYDPAADVWNPTSLTYAPSARALHTAVWTGSFMVVWGGFTNEPDTIGRYALGQSVDDDGDGFSECQGDCNDSNPEVHPGAVEVCDGLDNDCNALVDDGLPASTYFVDADGDGVGDSTISTVTCSPPAGFVTGGGDCNDSNAAIWGTPSEVQGDQFTDSATLTWPAPSAPGAAADLYDVLRSTDPTNFVVPATCPATRIPGMSATDATVPLPGQVFFYLVRADNSCPNGLGSLGTDSSGTARIGRACP